MSSIQLENKLDYVRPPSMALANSSRYQTFHAPNKRYTDGHVIEVRLHVSSNDFTDPSKSYVVFNFTGTTATLGITTYPKTADIGSMLGCFSNVQVILPNGETLDIHDDVFLTATIDYLYRTNVDTFNRIAPDIGFNVVNDVGIQYGVRIPLNYLVSLFKCQQLLPPDLINGMTLRFTVSDGFIMVQNDAAFDWRNNINTFKVVLKTYNMSNTAITQLKATPKKTITYPCYHHVNTLFPNTGASSVGIRMTSNFECSKALRAMSYAINSPTTGDERYSMCLMGDTEGATYSGVKWRIGAHITEPLNSQMEIFNITNDVIGVPSDSSAITWDSTRDINVVAFDLTRSPVGDGGTPINNHNQLIVEYAKNGSTKPQMGHLFIEYEKNIPW